MNFFYFRLIFPLTVSRSHFQSENVEIKSEINEGILDHGFIISIRTETNSQWLLLFITIILFSII